MILVYAETEGGKLKKSAFETVSFANKTARKLGANCTALVMGKAENAGQLAEYGAEKILQVDSDKLSDFDSQLYTDVIAQVREKTGDKILILSDSSTGKSILGRLAVRLNADAVSGVFALPEGSADTLKVKKWVFSGKAIAHYRLNSDIKVISLMGNSVKAEKVGGTATVAPIEVNIEKNKVEIIERKKQTGDKAPLPEAELVVSAGRGMKGPENWGIIEELADALGATLACSRPVADSGWRPHHEHVGQTGTAIKPNLYIAAGISGAIQHLAGVNQSKCIVVINKDPEAPFFKAATYGVCADLFDVVPRLTEAIKKAKAQ